MWPKGFKKKDKYKDIVFLIYSFVKHLCSAWKVNLTSVEPGGLIHGSISSAWSRVSPTFILYKTPNILERTDEHLPACLQNEVQDAVCYCRHLVGKWMNGII